MAAKKNGSTLVAIVMGSDSDWETMKAASVALKEFGINAEVAIKSAHRTPHDVASFAEAAAERGIKVIIAGAGGAAHLPGMVAAYTHLPVIGVPVAIGPMQGEDALWSIVQMPSGVPVATVAIGNAKNAGILAAQILATSDDSLAKKLIAYKAKMAADVRAKKLR